MSSASGASYLVASLVILLTPPVAMIDGADAPFWLIGTAAVMGAALLGWSTWLHARSAVIGTSIGICIDLVAFAPYLWTRSAAPAGDLGITTGLAGVLGFGAAFAMQATALFVMGQNTTIRPGPAALGIAATHLAAVLVLAPTSLGSP